VSLTNLTPHVIRVFGWEAPDRFDLGGHQPLLELPPSGTVARIGEIDLGGTPLKCCDAPVEMIEYRHLTGMPPVYDDWDKNTDWYVVSLPVALACSPDSTFQPRNDLLVPWREVRNLEGTVIGCRALALPV
jgi:hypothetical protein